MSGSTPMTKIKVYGVIVGLMCVLAWGIYNFYWVPNHPAPVVDQPFVNGQIVAGSGYVSVNVMPIQRAAAATIAPTIKPPTATPVLHSTPTPAPSCTYPTYYPNPSFIPPVTTNPVWNNPTPAPNIGENEKYINEFNYYRAKGFNVQYDLKQNIQVKAGSSYTLKAVVTSLKDERIEHLTGTLTIVTLNNDPMLNIVPIPPQTVLDKDTSIEKWDSYTLDKSVTIPNYKGHFKLYLVITGDNGAYAQIMQEVTIV